MPLEMTLRYHHLIDSLQIGERQGKIAQWRRCHIFALSKHIVLGDHRRMPKVFSKYHFYKVGLHVGHIRHQIIIDLCQRTLQGQASQFARQ